MKKRRLFTLLLAICMVVSLIPTVAFASEGTAAAQTTGAQTYTVDVTDSSHKVGVNGGTPVNSQIDSTGIILNPGDKLVWTSTGGKEKRRD